MLTSYRTINSLDYISTCMRCFIGIQHTVNAEITVVLFFTVVTAIGILILIFIATVVENSMVCPFPYTTAHKVVVSINAFPIFFNCTGAYTHSVNIFAHKIWFFVISLILCSLRTIFSYILLRRIHFRNYIISKTFCVNYTFIMNRDF